MTPIIRPGREVTTPCCHYALLTDSTNPTRDWLADVVGDVAHWAVEQGSAVLESALVVAQVGAAAHAQRDWSDACPIMCLISSGVRRVCAVCTEIYMLNALFLAGLMQFVTHARCCATTTACPASHATCYCCGDLFPPFDILQSCLGGLAGMLSALLDFSVGPFSTALGLAQQMFAAVTGTAGTSLACVQHTGLVTHTPPLFRQLPDGSDAT
jgi:hypothetical protein